MLKRKTFISVIFLSNFILLTHCWADTILNCDIVVVNETEKVCVNRNLKAFNAFVAISEDFTYITDEITSIYLLSPYMFTLPRNIFSIFKNVKELQIYSQMPQLREIQDNFFLNASKLEKLTIVGQKICNLNENNFKGANNLTNLFLPSNQIETIHEQAFNGLIKCIFIVISNNRIKFLHPNTFTGLPNLEVIDLARNFLENESGKFINERLNLPATNLDVDKDCTVDFSNYSIITSIENNLNFTNNNDNDGGVDCSSPESQRIFTEKFETTKRENEILKIEIERIIREKETYKKTIEKLIKEKEIIIRERETLIKEKELLVKQKGSLNSENKFKSFGNLSCPQSAAQEAINAMKTLIEYNSQLQTQINQSKFIQNNENQLLKTQVEHLNAKVKVLFNNESKACDSSYCKFYESTVFTNLLYEIKNIKDFNLKSLNQIKQLQSMTVINQYKKVINENNLLKTEINDLHQRITKLIYGANGFINANNLTDNEKNESNAINKCDFKSTVLINFLHEVNDIKKYNSQLMTYITQSKTIITNQTNVINLLKREIHKLKIACNVENSTNMIIKPLLIEINEIKTLNMQLQIKNKYQQKNALCLLNEVKICNETIITKLISDLNSIKGFNIQLKTQNIKQNEILIQQQNKTNAANNFCDKTFVIELIKDLNYMKTHNLKLQNIVNKFQENKTTRIIEICKNTCFMIDNNFNSFLLNEIKNIEKFNIQQQSQNKLLKSHIQTCTNPRDLIDAKNTRNFIITQYKELQGVLELMNASKNCHSFHTFANVNTCEVTTDYNKENFTKIIVEKEIKIANLINSTEELKNNMTFKINEKENKIYSLLNITDELRLQIKNITDIYEQNCIPISTTTTSKPKIETKSNFTEAFQNSSLDISRIIESAEREKIELKQKNTNCETLRGVDEINKLMVSHTTNKEVIQVDSKIDTILDQMKSMTRNAGKRPNFKRNFNFNTIKNPEENKEESKIVKILKQSIDKAFKARKNFIQKNKEKSINSIEIDLHIQKNNHKFSKRDADEEFDYPEFEPSNELSEMIKRINLLSQEKDESSSIKYQKRTADKDEDYDESEFETSLEMNNMIRRIGDLINVKNQIMNNRDKKIKTTLIAVQEESDYSGDGVVRRSMDQQLESNDAIVDAISDFKQKFDNDSKELEATTKDIGKTLENLLKTVDEVKSDVKPKIQKQINALRAAIEKKDGLMVPIYDEIEDQFDDLMDKRTNLINEQEQFDETLNDELDQMDKMTNTVSTIDKRLGICEKNSKILKKKLNEANKKFKKKKHMFSLFPLLIG